MELPKYKREYCCPECGLIWIEEISFANRITCPKCNSELVYACDTMGYAYAYNSIVDKLKKEGKVIHYAKDHPYYKKEFKNSKSKDVSEYINPVDNIIRDLEQERDRRIKAYDSNDFCDNITLKNNIKILTKGIMIMKIEREKMINKE